MSKVSFTDCVEIVGEAPKRFMGEKIYVSTGAVNCNEIDLAQTEIVSYDNRPSRANLVADEGDILFAKMHNTRKVLLVNADLKENIYSTGFCAVRAKKQFLTKECLFYILNSPQFLSQKDKYCSGATQKAITNEALSKLILTVPEISKQEEAVKNLDKISKLIEKRKQQLQKLDLLVKSEFNEMFGDTLTNNRGWEVCPLGELCTIVRGASPRPIEKFLGGDVPWIKIGDATAGDNVYLNSTKEHIVQDAVAKSRLVKAGSLIFANCGVSLGFARIITFEGCIHDGWLAMENIDERLNKIFLLQALNQMTEHFRKIAPSGTQPNLNTSIMKSHRQIIPPMEIQNDYIKFVEKTDKTKIKIKQSLEKLETLKKAVMQKYFG